MTNLNTIRPTLVFSFYVTQTIVNWLYILWVQHLPGIVIGQSFMVLITLTYFYLVFAIVAVVLLYFRKLTTLMLSYVMLSLGVYWALNSPGLHTNAWFVILPMLTYFYFTFALVAGFWLYQRTQLGLIMSIGVLIFGVCADVISYYQIYQLNFLLEQLLLPLICINLFVLGYMAINHSYFNDKMSR